MCTVTIIPIGVAAACSHDSAPTALGGGIRLACNRDELRTRPVALSPVIRTFGDRKAIMPVDTVSTGTWIAVNDAGIAATLLNVNIDLTAIAGGRQKASRGTLIPRLMALETFDQVIEASAAIEPSLYAPFRLVVVNGERVCSFYSDGQTLREEHSFIKNDPYLFTSSGLGDALVEGPRRELFDHMFTTGEDWLSAQVAFHRHSWPDRRHLSVCMERSEARTVSHTVIEIKPDRVALTYCPDAPDHAEPLAPITLARSKVRK